MFKGTQMGRVSTLAFSFILSVLYSVLKNTTGSGNADFTVDCTFNAFQNIWHVVDPHTNLFPSYLEEYMYKYRALPRCPEPASSGGEGHVQSKTFWSHINICCDPEPFMNRSSSEIIFFFIWE